jgi:hypothetical protein
LLQTPDTPYGAFLGRGNPSPKTRKFWKRQCDELGRFEMSEEEKEEQKVWSDFILFKKIYTFLHFFLPQARRKMLEEKGDEWEARQAAKAREFDEYADLLNAPERVKAIHEKWADNMEAKGIPVLAR